MLNVSKLISIIFIVNILFSACSSNENNEYSKKISENDLNKFKKIRQKLEEEILSGQDSWIQGDREITSYFNLNAYNTNSENKCILKLRKFIRVKNKGSYSCLYEIPVKDIDLSELKIVYGNTVRLHMINDLKLIKQTDETCMYPEKYLNDAYVLSPNKKHELIIAIKEYVEICK